MSDNIRSAFISQVRAYKKAGFGIGGSFLKHSLYPIKYFKRILPSYGTIVDLGCGEGMLTNLLSRILPGAELIGVDRDKGRIEKAKIVSAEKTRFIASDIMELNISGARAAIVNDVLHHHPYDHQERLLLKVHQLLDDDGLLVLKEVDAEDKADKAWTSFWDKKLYPEDKLFFRKTSDWKEALKKAGFRVLETYRVKHFWPASRTVLVATKKPKLSMINIDNSAAGEVKVLLTGVTGFIGEHLARELLMNGIGGKKTELTLVVRNLFALPDYLRNSKRVKMVVCDLKDIGSKKRELEEYEYVFHLASKVAFFAGKKIIEENVIPTKNLLDVISRSKLKRFVYASTMGALDRARNDDCSSPLHEESSAHPVSHYGISKLEGEELVKNSSLPYSIVRIPWCYGPGMSKTHHVRVLFEKLMRGGFVFRFNWPGKVSIIEATELARIMSEVASSQKAANETYFVSDGHSISFGELFREMGRIVGRKSGTINIPGIFIWLAKIFRAFAPFQLKSLYMNVLSVSTDKIKGIGIEIKNRQPDFLLPLARYINQEKYPSRNRDVVFITGAASGIGLSLANKFYALGWGLFLLDRNEDALRSAAKKLECRWKTMDLADRSLWGELQKIISNNKDIQIVVNNAGIGARGRFEELNWAVIENIINVNSIVPALISHAFIEKHRGTIINIASSSAFQPLPYMAAYTASKAFMLNFSQSITGENIGETEIITVSPSGTATGFQGSSGVKSKKGEKLLDPDLVASDIISLIGKGSRNVVIGRSGKLMHLASRILPVSMQIKLWEYLMRKMR